MIGVKTDSGFVCEINENVLDDVEIIDVLVELDEGNPTHIGKAAKKLLREDAAKLYEHIRTEDDRVPLTELAKEIADIIGKISEAKK